MSIEAPERNPRILTQAEKDDIIFWILAHQATGERIVSLNAQQYKAFKRKDIVGVIELPNLNK